MRRERRESESGQSTAEYAVIVAGIVVVCALAALFIGATIAARIGSPTKPAQQGPFQPPSTVHELVWPTRLEECEDGGWRNFAQFENQRECEEYVNDRRP